MSQVIVFVQQVTSAFPCRRRNAAGTLLDSKEALQVSKGLGNGHEHFLGSRSNDSTDLDSDPPNLSSSGSDIETRPSNLRAQLLKRENTQLHSDVKRLLGKLTAADAAIVLAAFEARGSNITAENSLSANLEKLASVDSKHVFMVRKIANLGSNSPQLLKNYFSKFGNVDKVFVNQSIDKRSILQRPVVRPANTGFIVMETADDVANIFKQGLEHIVSGSVIALTAYEHHGNRNVLPNLGLLSSYANITEDNTMEANMRKMAKFDANRIFKVRKINKLGVGSSQMLQTHFEKFGRVTNVFVTHSIDRRKANRDPRAKPQVRRAGIGFVVMDNAEDVNAIFKHGTQHTLYGVQISIVEYHHRLADESVTVDNSIDSPND